MAYSDSKECCTVDIEDGSGQYVKVNLWRDRANLMEEISKYFVTTLLFSYKFTFWIKKILH